MTIISPTASSRSSLRCSAAYHGYLSLEAVAPPGLLDLLMEAVCLRDEEGIVQYANAASAQVLGVPAAQLVGAPL